MSPMEKAGRKPGQLIGTGVPLLYYRYLADGKTKVFVHRNGKTKKPTVLQAKTLTDAKIEQGRRFPAGGHQNESDGNARFDRERWMAFVNTYERASTRRAYTAVWDRFLGDVLDGRRIESGVTKKTVKAIDDDLKERGYSQSTRARVQKSLSAFYRRAMEQGVASHNPCTALARDDKVNYKAARKVRREDILTDVELAAIVDGALLDNGNAHIYATIFELAPLMGLRISEMLGLCWDRVDFERKQILIDRQLDETFKPAEPETWFSKIQGNEGDEEKVKSRIRMVPMTPDVERVLRAHFAWTFGEVTPLRPDGLLFTTRKKTPIGQEALRQALLRAASRAGVTKRVFFHLFRHTCASILFEADVVVAEIARILGDSVEVIEDTYVVFLNEGKQRADDLATKLAARKERLAS